MTDEPQRFMVASRSRRVSIEVAVDGAVDGEVRVDGGTVRSEPDGSFTIAGDAAGRSITLHCPPGSHVSIGTLTGRVETSGPLGEVSVVTETGKIRIDRAERVDVRARTGNVQVGDCVGECRLVTVSGKVEVGSAGTVEIASRSGKVDAQALGGGQVRTVSGSIHIGLREPSEADGATLPWPPPGAPASAASPMALRVMSTSGGVDIELPPGARPTATLHSKSGRITSSVPAGTDAAIEVRTTSGSIRVGAR